MSDDTKPEDAGVTADGEVQVMDDQDMDNGDLSGDAQAQTGEISSRQIDVLAAASDIPPQSGERRSAFMGVPIDVTVSIGRARPLVSELIKLQRDSVLTLDSKIEDPVELFIGDRLIARGELQEMDDETGQLGVRLTEVADLSTGV